MYARKKTTTADRALHLKIAVYFVGLHGVLILAGTLHTLAVKHRVSVLNSGDLGFQILAGLSLVYLSSLLRRNKRNAFIITLGLYIFILGFNASAVMTHHASLHDGSLPVIEKIVVPFLIAALLMLNREFFTVKSDMRSFVSAVRTAALILLVTLVYGVVGFSLLDEKDFHEEISVPVAIQRTVDQFDITTKHPLIARTHRAQVFEDSLSFIGIGALVFVFLSFFQPLRVRFAHNPHMYLEAERLLRAYPTSSDDYFKIWPHDKLLIFSPDRQAAIAYRVVRGVALVVSGPFGKKGSMAIVQKNFEELCYTNDWLPAVINTGAEKYALYEKLGYTRQLLGQEAVVDCQEFLAGAGKNKYFRQIQNRFEKHGYHTELLLPPHDSRLLSQLQTISDEWLSRPGRAEHGFMMGYFNDEYLQSCRLLVAKDDSGIVQAFLNEPPHFSSTETTYDMLRGSGGSLGNTQDYLLMSFIALAASEGYKTVNFGLSPLAGLSEDQDGNLVSAVMRVIYRGGDRFYSFAGLRKFKAKYNPLWKDKYVLYKNGVPGFSRTMGALIRALNKHA